MAHFSHTGGSSCPHMNDETRPNDERFRSIYETGFRTWAQLYSLASNKRKLLSSYPSPQEAFPQHPSFPATALVECDEYQAFVTASSLWDSKASICNHDLPSFKRPVQIGITAKKPISLSTPELARDNASYDSWFVSDDNYLPVLVLAWTYILSARWAELMPATCSLEYTQAFAPHSNAVDDPKTGYKDGKTVYVDVGYADQEEARWWSAILSQGQGWRASMRLAHITFLSPWSTNFQSGFQFLVSHRLQPSFSSPNPTFSTACEYLTTFCIRHNLTDQSHAALAVALLLPSMNDGGVLQRPAPRIGKPTLLPSPRKDEAYSIQCPDRLLMLSCNIRGIRPMLLSVFYEPQIECNTVTPWLQGTLSAIDILAKKDPCTIGRMCMERTPEIAYLWLGATILGTQERLLQDVRRGQIPFNLESAAWSGTIQSFMQQPVSNPPAVHGHVTRADECRLLFLSRSDRYVRCPVCQWKPFGATSVEDVEVEVRAHCGCRDHQLQYRGLLWNNADGKCSLEEARLQTTSHPTTAPFGGGEQVLVSYEALSRKNEVISENATRSIFGWLRSDGWTHNEKEMSQHPWLDMCDSESEDEDEDQFVSSEDAPDLSHVTSWIHG